VPADPLALLLLPGPLEGFILRDLARDLLRAPGMVALGPGRVPYGAYGRMPAVLARVLARARAGRLSERLARGGRSAPRVVMIFHPLQLPLAEALLDRHPGAELWYSRWDRYEFAYDASPKLRERLLELHERAARRASEVFAVSGALVEVERQAGRSAVLAPPPHDSFPAPEPAPAVIAVSLGQLGWRTDWALLRAVAEAMGEELVLLLIGAWHEEECASDPDFRACRAAPNLVWLGHRPEEEAARLVLCADVGIVPFKTEEFNDAALPQRIVKYARLGRRTIAPRLRGVLTWERAVTRAGSAEEWVAVLRARAGDRVRPDLELRAWALAQTAPAQNEPLWERLEGLGIGRPGRPGHAPAQRPGGHPRA